jgi:hypothetical protein
MTLYSSPWQWDQVVDTHIVQKWPQFPNRLGRKTCPVLDAPDAFFLYRRDELSVNHYARRRIAVISVDAQNDHLLFLRIRLTLLL